MEPARCGVGQTRGRGRRRRGAGAAGRGGGPARARRVVRRRRRPRGIGPRQVGSIMKLYGSNVTWWRVTNSYGDLPVTPHGRGARALGGRGDPAQAERPGLPDRRVPGGPAGAGPGLRGGRGGSRGRVVRLTLSHEGGERAGVEGVTNRGRNRRFPLSPGETGAWDPASPPRSPRPRSPPPPSSPGAPRPPTSARCRRRGPRAVPQRRRRRARHPRRAARRCRRWRSRRSPSGFEHGWDIGFLPDGRALVTERPGRISLVSGLRKGADVTRVRADLDDVYVQGEGGLMGMVVHPDFATLAAVHDVPDP